MVEMVILKGELKWVDNPVDGGDPIALLEGQPLDQVILNFFSAFGERSSDGRYRITVEKFDSNDEL
jgi:hypothetical protein